MFRCEPLNCSVSELWRKLFKLGTLGNLWGGSRVRVPPRLRSGSDSGYHTPTFIIKMVTRSELLELLSSDFKRFIYDPFLTAESLVFTKTGTAQETRLLHELKLATGVMANSTLKCRYNNNIFNPWYSEAYWHLHLNSMKDVFAFFGFKEGVGNPTSVMTENHIGIIVEDGKMFFSSADGDNQQKVEITGIDMTTDFIYKITKSRLYTFPLPQIVPYFDEFRIITPDRVWSLRQDNSTYLFDDTVYHCMFFIENLVGSDKFFKIKKFVYGEQYAD